MDMEAAVKRIPPHSTEAEQAVLGAMLMNKEAVSVASEMLSGDDFYQTAYGILFDAVVELFHEGKPVDLITLQEYLKEKNVPPEISSMEIVRELLVGDPDLGEYQVLCGDCEGQIDSAKPDPASMKRLQTSAIWKASLWKIYSTTRRNGSLSLWSTETPRSTLLSVRSF